MSTGEIFGHKDDGDDGDDCVDSMELIEVIYCYIKWTFVWFIVI